MKAGFKYVILLGDHGGNQDPLGALAPTLDARYRPQVVRVFFSGDSYAKADAEVEAYLEAQGLSAQQSRRRGGHLGGPGGQRGPT